MTKTYPRAARRRLAAVVAPAAALLLLVGCSSAPEEPPTPPPVTVTPEVTPSRSAPPSPPEPEPVWPLTGQPGEPEEIAARAALAVKVENTSAARPQAGLEEADVVWETVVEYSVPRFIAVFHSQSPEKVGPIRSARPMDAAIVAPLQGVFAASGGQGGILRMIRRAGSQVITHDGGAGGFYRSSARRAPHNVYAAAADLVAHADDSRALPPAEQFRFAADAASASAVQTGTDAATLAVRLGNGRPSWTWDADSGTWLRSEGGTASNSEDGVRLAATNVVLMSVVSVPSGFRAQGSTSVPTYELSGESGTAVVAQGGKIIEASWTKESDEAPILLVDDDGAPVLLAPGNTWVEMVPQGSGGWDIS